MFINKIMENNYQHKKDNINDKDNLRNLKRKNESLGTNNQNRGYLNIFKSKKHLASVNNQEIKKNDFKRKNSKSSDKKVRSQSEPNMNPRNENENISLKAQIENGFLEIKKVMNTNFGKMDTNFKKMNTNLEKMNTNLKEMNIKIDKGFNNINELLNETNKLLSKLNHNFESKNKSGNNQNNEEENNKSKIPSKNNIDMKDNIHNDNKNNDFIYPNDNIKNTFLNNNNSINNKKYIFPNNKISTIDKLNYVNNPKDNDIHISLKDIEGFDRNYKKRDEPMDNKKIKTKHYRNISNIPSYINNKNTRGPLDTYRIKSKTQYANINEPNINYNYSYRGTNLSNIENKAVNFISNSNKSSEE